MCSISAFPPAHCAHVPYRLLRRPGPSPTISTPATARWYVSPPARPARTPPSCTPPPRRLCIALAPLTLVLCSRSHTRSVASALSLSISLHSLVFYLSLSLHSLLFSRSLSLGGLCALAVALAPPRSRPTRSCSRPRSRYVASALSLSRSLPSLSLWLALSLGVLCSRACSRTRSACSRYRIVKVHPAPIPPIPLSPPTLPAVPCPSHSSSLPCPCPPRFPPPLASLARADRTQRRCVLYGTAAPPVLRFDL